MVSHASSRRTRLLSCIIFRIANASPSVIASGKPSGIATTTMVTASMKNVSTSSPSQCPTSAECTIQRIIDTVNVRTAMMIPILPMFIASLSRRSCNGVSSGSTMSPLRIRPHCERSPTATIRTCPTPSETDVPEITNGSFSCVFEISITSPVIADSLVLRLAPSISTPSAASLSPAEIFTTSPTTTSSATTAMFSPSRVTITS
mmetsp:Transcript_14750/g.31609  ORF Transcript_14750/g.31609 Transcript_14750/m.31609 type:complete len:204 (+) Transcript_14750:2295-2906(+)